MVLNSNQVVHCPTFEIAHKVTIKIGKGNASNWGYYTVECCFNNEGCYAPKGFYVERGYEIISAEQFLNMKTYKLIRQYPGSEELGATTTDDMSKFPEFWEEVKEPCKVGDYVITKDYSDDYDGKVLKISTIDREYCYFTPCNDSEHNFAIKHILRKATPEEIQKYQEIKIGGYIGEMIKEGIKFGCQIITKEEIETMKKMVSSPINAKITIQGTEITLGLLTKIQSL